MSTDNQNAAGFSLASPINLRSGPTPASLDRLDVAGALPAAATSIFAGTGWSPTRPIADLLALVTAGLLPGSALTMNWKDLISKVIGEWAHLLDRSRPTIPSGSPLAGAFVPGVDPLTGASILRSDPLRLSEVFAGLETSVALLLGGLYPRLFAHGGPGVPAATQQVAQAGLIGAASGQGGGGSHLSSTGIGSWASINALVSMFSPLRNYWRFLTSDEVVTPDSGESTRPFWLVDDYNRHKQAQDKALAAIRADVVARGGDPKRVKLEYRIDGGSKKNNEITATRTSFTRTIARSTSGKSRARSSIRGSFFRIPPPTTRTALSTISRRIFSSE